MRHNYLFLLLSAAALVSCTKESCELVSQASDFKAVAESTTKTVLGSDALSINWKSGDLITISNGTATAVYSATPDGSDASKADFSISSGTGLSGNSFAAVYPSTATIGTGSFNVVIPTVQDYAAGSFADGALPMVAVCGEERELSFKAAASVLCVTPSILGKQSRIMNIKVVDDNYIAGNITVTYDGSDVPSFSNGTEKAVTLRAKSGSDECTYADAIEAGLPVNIVLAPCTTSANLKITIALIDEDGTKATHTLKPGTAKTFARAQKNSVGASVKNLGAYVDLSAAASANCYVVNAAGYYKIKAVKGNSTTALSGAASATPIWESCCNWYDVQAGDIVKNVFYEKGYVYFNTASTKMAGNALIGVLDSEGNMLWSWHIWVPSSTISDITLANGVKFQDRNLGALVPTFAEASKSGAGESYGLIYQWGRKDPFLNGPALGTNSKRTQVAFSWPVAGNRDTPGWTEVNVGEGTNTIEYTIAHPSTKLLRNGSTDWYKDAASEGFQTARWTSAKKTIYDPCPAGYRVPTGDDSITDLRHTGMVNGAVVDGTTYTWDAANQGLTIGSPICPSGSIWFPAIAFTDNGTTAVNTTINYGAYWTANYMGATAEARIYYFNFLNGGQNKVYWGSSKPKSFYMGVRCVKEQ